MDHLDKVLQYTALHVHIFPCHWMTENGCSCGDIACVSPGKHPIAAVAPRGHKDASNDPAVIRQWWQAYPSANPAMSLAPSGLVVIDIDPRNGGDQTFDALEAEHGRIESDVEQLTGGGGRHIVFVAKPDDRFPGKLGPGVDVKHQGYIMVWPSNHASGGAYEWEGSSDLLEGNTPSMRPDWLALPKQDAFNTNINPCAAGLGLSVLSPGELSELKSALDTIPNEDRDTWLHVGMAIHSIDSGKDGFALWENWSSTSSKFDPQDQCRVWFSFHGKPNQLNKESIFFWAQENGWANPLKPVVSEDVRQAAAKVVEKLGRIAPAPETHELVKPPLPVFPVQGLDDVAAIIGRAGYVNYPDVTQAAAVMLACVAASRRYIGSHGESCHLYMGVSSTSVGMIRYAVNAVQSVLVDAGMRHLFSSARKSTAHIIYEHLTNRPAHLYCVEDFGKMLQQAKRQYGNGAMEHAIDTLCGIYSKSVLQVDIDEVVKRRDEQADNRVIYQPALSMLALTSQDQLSGLMRAAEIGSGLMVNMLQVIADEADMQENKEPVPVQAPQSLRHQLAALRGVSVENLRPDNTFDFTNERGDFAPDNSVIVTLPDFSDYDSQIMALSDRRVLLPLLHGARINMRRIAIALAAWGNPVAPVISDTIMQFSADFVMRHTTRFIDEFTVMESGDDGKVSVYQKVLKTIIDKGPSGTNEQGIRDACYSFRKMDREKREALMDLLEEDGEVMFFKEGKRKTWVAMRFVKKETRENRESRESQVIPFPELQPRAGAASSESR